MEKQNEENLKTLSKEFITRELWLKTAVRMIDEVIFEGQLPDKEFQISCGRTPSERVLGECITIRDDMKIEEEDRFPITIHLNEKIKDPIELIVILVHECIHGFHGIRGHGKAFASVAHNIGFDKPYKEYHPNTLLLSNVEVIYNRLVLLLGDFPHKPIVTQVGELKERKKNTYTLFCDCGFECTAKKDMVEKFGIPTCACGKKMGIDYEEGKEE